MVVCRRAGVWEVQLKGRVWQTGRCKGQSVVRYREVQMRGIEAAAVWSRL